MARRFSLPMVTGVALTIGLLAAFGTDFILSRGRRLATPPAPARAAPQTATTGSIG